MCYAEYERLDMCGSTVLLHVYSVYFVFLLLCIDSFCYSHCLVMLNEVLLAVPYSVHSLVINVVI